MVNKTFIGHSKMSQSKRSGHPTAQSLGRRARRQVRARVCACARAGGACVGAWVQGTFAGLDDDDCDGD